MWTSEEKVLEAAVQRLCELLRRPAMELPNHLYERKFHQEHWSAGLNKKILEVHFQGWEAPTFFHLKWDNQLDIEAEWEISEAGVSLRAPQKPGLTAEEERRLIAKLRPVVSAKLGRETRVTLERSYAVPARPDMTLYRGKAWQLLEADQVMVRFHAETGAFMGWRHNLWMTQSSQSVENPPAEALRRLVEASPLFPKGMRFRDHWVSGDQPGMQELLWARFVDEEEVENDSVYAVVNCRLEKVAECLINWSEIDSRLDLNLEQAMAEFAKAYGENFPSAVRCGMPFRMYMDMDGQPLKPRAWVANAMEDSGPVQISIGNGGEVLRVDSVV